MLPRLVLFLFCLASAEASPLFYRLAYAYLDACCFTLNGEEFEKILSSDVKLWHQTNDEEVFQAEGRKEVSDLFRKYIFSNSSDIDVKKFTLEESVDGMLIDLLVEENKEGEGRYLFHEKTLLRFNSSQISSIEMQIYRNNLKNRIFD